MELKRLKLGCSTSKFSLLHSWGPIYSLVKVLFGHWKRWSRGCHCACKGEQRR